jgi:hypothetical protein
MRGADASRDVLPTIERVFALLEGVALAAKRVGLADRVRTLAGIGITQAAGDADLLVGPAVMPGVATLQDGTDTLTFSLFAQGGGAGADTSLARGAARAATARRRFTSEGRLVDPEVTEHLLATDHAE